MINDKTVKGLVGFQIFMVVYTIITWVVNIIKLAGMKFSDFTLMLVLRIVAIFVVPLNWVLAWL